MADKIKTTIAGQISELDQDWYYRPNLIDEVLNRFGPPTTDAVGKYTITITIEEN